MKEYIGIITIYKNVYIEAENEKEAWKKLKQLRQEEESSVEDCYCVSKDTTLTK